MKLILILLASLIFPTSVIALEYKIFAANPPGGGATDAVSRLLADEYNKKYKDNKLIVMNVIGANHIATVQSFKKEKVSAIVLTSTMGIFNYVDNLELPYTDQDFNVISLLGFWPNVYFVRDDSKINDPQDILSLAKTDKPFIGGNANSSLININSIKQKQINIVPVLFKSPNETLLDVLAGRISVGIASTGSTSVIEYARANKIKIIGSTAESTIVFDQRAIPSVSSRLQIPQFSNFLWLAVSPGNTPEHQTFIARLKEILDSPAFAIYAKQAVMFNLPAGTDPTKKLFELRKQVLQNKNLLGR